MDMLQVFVWAFGQFANVMVLCICLIVFALQRSTSLSNFWGSGFSDVYGNLQAEVKMFVTATSTMSINDPVAVGSTSIAQRALEGNIRPCEANT